MNQPPDEPPYYDSPTENTPLPPQWQQGQYPQQASSPNYPQQAYPPNAGPVSQPGFSPQPQGYPQQGSSPNYPGQPGPGGYPGSPQPGPGGYPGQPQPGFAPQQPGQYSAPPSWPNMAQPPQAPKKSNIGCIITSVILIVVLLVGGGAAFAFVRSQQASTNVSATATAAAATQTVKVTVTPTTSVGTTPTITIGSTTGTVGQPIQAGTTWIATVTGAKTTTASSFPPKPGQTYLEVSISLQNVSSSKQVVSSLLEFSLRDTGGKSYNEALTDTNVTKLVDGDVEVNQTLNGQIAFEVPQSSHTFLLTFTYGLAEGSNASVSWPLAV